MMDASGLRYHIGKGREGTLVRIVIPLVVISKGETSRRHHFQAVVNKIASKLKVGFWLYILNG